MILYLPAGAYCIFIEYSGGLKMANLYGKHQSVHDFWRPLVHYPLCMIRLLVEYLKQEDWVEIY